MIRSRSADESGLTPATAPERLPIYTMPETSPGTCGRAQKRLNTCGKAENALTFVVMKKVSYIIRRVRRRVVMTK